MSRMQLNSKFVNNMLPEYGRFVTAVKLNRGLRDSNYDQLYAYLKQHETHAKENKMMLDRFSQHTVDPLALMYNVSNQQRYSPSSSTSPSIHVPPYLADNAHLESSLSPTKNLIENLTNTLALLTKSYKTFLPQTNNQLRTSSNTRNHTTVQDGRVVVQNVQGRQNRGQGMNPRGGGAAGYGGVQNRVGNANPGQARQAQENEDLALNVDNLFQADECDAFDSDVDEAPMAQTMFMANLSSANHVTDEARPSYDSDIISENTLVIAEITRRKMNDKMKDPECVTHKVKIAPHDYLKENFLATFTPQKQLTPDQIFWSQDLIKLKSKALKEQTTVSRQIKALTVELHTGLTEGERGFKQTMECYLKEVIPFFKTLKENFEGIQKALTKEIKEMKDVFKELEVEVAQNVVDRKHDAIERKNLLIANDNLIAECLSKEVFSVATNSELIVARFSETHVANTKVEARCLALEVELSNLRDKSHHDNHEELVNHFSKLEVNHLNLQLKYQDFKDSFGNNPPTPDKDTPNFDSVFVIGKMQAFLQGKDNVIRQLKNKISRLQETRSDTDRTFKVVQIILWYLDSGYSKHMMGDHSRLMNFVKKFTGTVRFENDHFGAIMGYGYYVIGDSVISMVYYVEGLGHNLFSVGKFCESDLEVAFRKHSCYVRDTNDIKLIKGSRGSNLYTISIKDMMKSSQICLLTKASKNKSWLWHRRLNHLNFGTINDLARKDLVRGLPRLKFEKDHLCSACQLGKSKKHTHKPKTENTNLEVLNTIYMDLFGPMRVQTINGKKYILVIVDDYSLFTWVKFLRSKDETLEAKAVATAFYNQNRSLIHTRHNKTLYELVHNKKLDLTFFRVFGALCYSTNDNEDLGKLQPTADIRIFVGYAPIRKGYRIYNNRTRRIMETIHI
uniref:Retrovirus-related Pol polyprotein from transposon TNT 1-94 n=1 Tax=Tanacetum cinerariifolium TaxID=118510 RepID=A0A699HGV5_TANCI|nr:retrovirus-related Pol polyprotein from transposon TNT 1-94 [Tanacetum cinerariifolium]